MRPRALRTYRQDEPLTWSDRLLFGGLSAVIGGVCGFFGSVFVAMFLSVLPPMLSATLLSAGYFFCVGVLRGADAGTHVGEALSAVAALGTAKEGSQSSMPESTRHFQWASFWVLAPWVLGMIALFVMQ